MKGTIRLCSWDAYPQDVPLFLFKLLFSDEAFSNSAIRQDSPLVSTCSSINLKGTIYSSGGHIDEVTGFVSNQKSNL